MVMKREELLGWELLKMCDLIEDEGLSCEQHEIITMDGYYL